MSESKRIVTYDVAYGIGSTRQSGRSIMVPVKAGGTIRMPLAEYREGASYTFEYEENGRLYRWTGQHAKTIDDEAAVFYLPDIQATK